ncbi:uncharacterized protein BP01DRAFT_384191 [Aspergillus saccharolyticus JOP 1030-1]|uniref:Uncharacterized protein n=1 Tax=Aspergillus saccharolyticus JOP 1030-1 TaxID=1450539 RepID=A0A318Z8X6_9EURO|nr:hypothetical protein BP01DRAFT_384191 [Aspergillus saccharolyticus JOP 1030-1]PYH43811.1 hypothetical protein BP01DRAFT_384191 [Aspergillus saccharolyticus JOP 1030-1]
MQDLYCLAFYASRKVLPVASMIGIGALQVLFTYTKTNNRQRIYAVCEEQIAALNTTRL